MLHFTRIGALVVFAALAGVAAVGDGEVHLNEDQKALYQEICRSLVAPCCWRESVAMHRSSESLQARDEIARMIAAGKSKREILDDFVARYGSRILIEPSGQRAQWLYIMPILALVIASWVAVRFLRKHLQKPHPA